MSKSQMNWDGVPLRPKMPTKLAGVGILLFIIVIVVAALALSSTVNIAGDEVGLVEKKLLGGKLPAGRIIAANRENGIQADMLMPGWHFWKFPWMYKIDKKKDLQIKDGFIGLLTAKDGKTLPPGTVYAPKWADPDKMVDAKYFLTEGNGYKGPQLTVLNPGNYKINTALFEVKNVPVLNVKVGQVAVIKSNVGERTETDDRLVPVGNRGVWNKAQGEGKYFWNTEAYEVTLIDIRQNKVSYTAEMEQGERLAGQPNKPIDVRSQDGFTFPVDVRITYQVEPENAPRAVAMIGGDELILDKVVTPRVRAVFRNNAEKVKALDYVKSRTVQQDQSLEMLREDLAKYGIKVLDVSIGAVGDEASLGTLLKTLTDREIALQEQVTFEEQQRAAEKEKSLKRVVQEAEEEKRLATAMYGVKVAEEDKKKVVIAAQAEAEQIALVAEAKAKAYELISKVVGPDNAALLEIMKLVATDEIKITPDVMVSGSGSATDALMGTMLKCMLDQQEQTSK
ncbi:MAG: SPFH domain-containing protein [Planctomycetota bacterium]|jgi:regulator of protease activity HflC (stomatin/prohibitin superfamily)